VRARRIGPFHVERVDPPDGATGDGNLFNLEMG